MLMLRTMMLRRKADPKTGKHILWEPAQSKCTCTLHKNHFVWKFTGRVPGPYPATSVLCEPAQSTYTRTFHKSHFAWKVTGKMAADLRGQHFVRACEVDMHMNMSQEAFRAEIYRENAGPVFCASLRGRNAHGNVTKKLCAEIYRENAGRFRYHLALTLTVRTPQCGHAVWGTRY